MKNVSSICNRELRELARLANKQGWEVKFTGGSHLKWIPPKGEFIITSSTPDTRHSFDNAKQSLERAGLITTAAALKRLTKPDTRKDTEVADPFCCRNSNCPSRFETQWSRDRHEERCEYRKAEIASPAKQRKEPTKDCPVCSKTISEKNLPAHVRRKHSEAGWRWVVGVRGRPGYATQSKRPWDDPYQRSEQPAALPSSTDNEALIAMMVEVVFPDGLPLHRSEVLRALADWSEQTEVFLSAVLDSERH